jgi:hypothetical protein
MPLDATDPHVSTNFLQQQQQSSEAQEESKVNPHYMP